MEPKTCKTCKSIKADTEFPKGKGVCKMCIANKIKTNKSEDVSPTKVSPTKDINIKLEKKKVKLTTDFNTVMNKGNIDKSDILELISKLGKLLD